MSSPKIPGGSEPASGEHGSPNIMVVMGTRPEGIKLAPVVLALQERRDRCRVETVVTGQHRQMLDQVLRVFGITPVADLDLMRPGQTPAEVTARTLVRLVPVLQDMKPDVLLVQGDTTTSFAAALAAFYQRIPVGHVEAGLRTFDKYAPFPEEINRRLTSCLVDWHFAPTEWSRQNLLQENVPPSSVFVTGNTVIDALLRTVDKGYQLQDARVRELLERYRVVLVTAHRRESFGEPLREICRSLLEIVQHHPDVAVIYPVHLNPEVQKPVRELLGDSDRIYLCAPMDYVPFVQLMDRCYLILTDSGGIQEEGPSLGKPVLVMREKTERPEGIEAGTVKLVGTARARIVAEASRLLTDAKAYAAMANVRNPYGDGKAAGRVVDILLECLGRTRQAVGGAVRG